MTINLEKALDIDAPIAELNPGLLPNGHGAHLEVTEKVVGGGMWVESGYAEVTGSESAAILQDSWSLATEAWTNSLNKTFQVFLALAWLPFQDAFAHALQPVRPQQGSST